MEFFIELYKASELVVTDGIWFFMLVFDFLTAFIIENDSYHSWSVNGDNIITF